MVNPNKIKHMKKMTKKNLGIIFQAKTGHGLFGHHISKWKKKDIDQTCQCCLEEDMETARHLWSECPAPTSKKQSTSQGKDGPMDVEIQFFETEPVRELMVLRTNNLP